MSRFRAAAALAAAVCLVFAATALASASKVTGGTTTVTPSSAAVSLLSANHITITPIAPATAASGAFTFPITGGRINTKTLHGILRHSGGLTVSNGTKTVALRHLLIVSDKRGAWITALVRDHTQRLCVHRPHHRLHCVVVTHLRTARIAAISGGSVTNGTFNGSVALTPASAYLINRLAGSQVVKAGASFGTVAITPTFS